MTTEELAFRAAIRADPGDDTHRLVYADWLQEHGRDERAEFIRADIELARCNNEKALPLCLCRPGSDGLHLANCPRGEEIRRLTHLNARRTKLIREHAKRWLEDEDGLYTTVPAGKSAQLRRPYPFEPRWSRGLVGQVSCDLADWPDFADHLTAIHPITEVMFWWWRHSEQLDLSRLWHYGAISRTHVKVGRHVFELEPGSSLKQVFESRWKRIAFFLR